MTDPTKDPIILAMQERLRALEAEQRALKDAMKAYYASIEGTTKFLKTSDQPKQKRVVFSGAKSIQNLAALAVYEADQRGESISTKDVDVFVRARRTVSAASSISAALSKLKVDGRIQVGPDGKWCLVHAPEAEG